MKPHVYDMKDDLELAMTGPAAPPRAAVATLRDIEQSRQRFAALGKSLHYRCQRVVVVEAIWPGGQPR